VLRRKGHRWRIVYDSLLAQALQSYVVSRRASDPAKPPRAATQAAARAVSALRLAALQPAPRRRPARAEQAPAQPGQTTVPTAPVVPGTATTPPATGTGTTTTGR
jgi:hypothetical protein